MRMFDESGNKSLGRGRVVVIAALFALIGLGTGLVIGARGFLADDMLEPADSVGGAGGAPADIDFSPVWKAWRVVDEKFVPASVSTSTPVETSAKDSNQERVWGMIQGLAGSLNDPYTYFLPPTESKQFSDDMNGSFEGVGMEIAVRDQMLTVVSPLKGTPSEKAGIRSGDRILKINGEDTRGMDITTAVNLIRGRRGSEVALFILRDGWDAPREIKVTRGVIDIPILITESRPEGIFVIRLMSFTANSSGLFRNALREFINSNDTKLILDLRGNPGGYLESAVEIASWFLPSGKVVVTEDYDGHGQNVVHRSRGYNVFNNNLRMVILVDHGSASASEILADSLRYYGVAKLVGATTFGKGSVQELIEITPETSLKLTIARWMGPDGNQIPNTGIIPDVEIEMSDEDIKVDKDPQMDKAVELVSSL